MNYELHTFGCKVNTYDSGLLQKSLDANSWNEQKSHVHILNTCAVTAQASLEAAKLARRIKSKDPFATVVVTGCAAQVDTEQFAQSAAVDLVIANSHKGFLPQLLEDHFKGKLKDKVFKSNIFRKDDLEPGGGIEEHHSRAFLKIQDGCNSFCTYCVIPFARGKSRSVSIQDLCVRVNELSAMGYQELVLTGVHIADYEDPSSKAGLEDLIEALLLKTKVPRFRLTSLEPGEVSDRLLDLYTDTRLCPHFHMSIQSATDPVLQFMKRRYLQKDVVQSLRRIEQKIPGVFIGMDVIVGFPNETNSLFEETVQVLTQLPWTKIHVFPYSERPGTKATQLAETVPWSERKHRAQKLRELSLHRFQREMLQQIGSTKWVLPLTKAKGQSLGLTRDYWNVRMPDKVGDYEHEVFMKITEAGMDGLLKAEVVL